MSDSGIDLSAIANAARLLEQGELVAFPTETVYGLGADAENPQAVAKIYAAKGRPADHPVIVHLPPNADLSHWAVDIPSQARELAKAFWPGPLTLILRRAPHIPDAVSGGQDSIGLRCPAHPVAQALLQEFRGGRGGLAAPSANKFGRVSPTTAAHVREEFEGDAAHPLACILDGGRSEVGIESTIVDLSRMSTHGPVLLRPGHIGAARIAEVIGVVPGQPDTHAPRASGTLETHYAPRTPVVLVEEPDVADLLTRLAAAGRRAAVIDRAPRPPGASEPHAAMPADPQGYARELYAALRAMDAEKADVILVVVPPRDEAWAGVNDRLRRAAHGSRSFLQQIS